MPIKSILIVDDSPTDRQFLSELLAKNGFQVSTAENADEALAKAKQHKPDHAGKAQKGHTKAKGGGKPSSVGNNGPAAHASSGGGSSNAAGSGKSQSAPKSSK